MKNLDSNPLTTEHGLSRLLNVVGGLNELFNAYGFSVEKEFSIPLSRSADHDDGERRCGRLVWGEHGWRIEFDQI